MHPAPANLGRHPLSPTLEPDFVGIQIVPAPRTARDSPLVIHGTFRIPWADAEAIEAPRQRALVVVVMNGTLHGAYTPFREQVLFEDDDSATRAGAHGFFNLDVFGVQGHDRPGDYHVFVSLGPHVSNVVRMAVA
jgi:hypothetical protein